MAYCYAGLAVSFPFVAGTTASTGTLAYPLMDAQAESTWVLGSVPRWFTRPKTVTHPGTNRARRRVTALIESNALPRRRAGTNGYKPAVLLPRSRSFFVLFDDFSCQDVTDCDILTRE